MRIGVIAGLLLLARSVLAGPDFTLLDMEGQTHKLSDYRGRWVVINYWATWCPPCREEIPELVLFHEKHKEHDAVVLGVNMEQVTTADLQAFVEQNFMTYPVLPGKPSMETVGPVPGLPTTYLIDPNGRLAARQVGAVTAEGIESFISKK